MDHFVGMWGERPLIHPSLFPVQNCFLIKLISVKGTFGIFMLHYCLDLYLSLLRHSGDTEGSLPSLLFSQ